MSRMDRFIETWSIFEVLGLQWWEGCGVHSGGNRGAVERSEAVFNPERVSGMLLSGVCVFLVVCAGPHLINTREDESPSPVLSLIQTVGGPSACLPVI